MKIKITKEQEKENSYNPNNIDEGFFKVVELSEEEFENFEKPRVGACFWVGFSYRTSVVTKLINDKKFETLNSVYKWEILKP